MDFRIMITEARKKLNLTQRDMAEKLNVSDKTISKWETGVNFPDLKMLNQISKVLGISVSDLLTADDLKQTQNDVDDNLVIGKFKIVQIVALILLGLSAICLRFFYAGLLIFLCGILLLGLSLILFMFSLLTFQQRYDQFQKVKKQDQISNFYSFLYFYSILLVVLFYYISFAGYVSIWFIYIPLIFLQVIPFLISKRILNRNNFTIKTDKLNLILLRIYWSILIGGNLLYCILLTGWFKINLEPTGYTFLNIIVNICWFSPLILGMIIPLRWKYNKSE